MHPFFFRVVQGLWRYGKFIGPTVNLDNGQAYYFLTINNQQSSKRVQQKQILYNPTRTISSFNDFAFHERELVNLSDFSLSSDSSSGGKKQKKSIRKKKKKL